jgi:hypothetical protein
MTAPLCPIETRRSIDEEAHQPSREKENSNLLQKGVIAMKKRSLCISFLVLIMLVATLAACGSTPKQESTGDYVDDSVITTKVKSMLAADEFLKSFQISVETRKGIVLLSGWVGSQAAVSKAGQIAKGVGGVKSVRNELIVK